MSTQWAVSPLPGTLHQQASLSEVTGELNTPESWPLDSKPAQASVSTSVKWSQRKAPLALNQTGDLNPNVFKHAPRGPRGWASPMFSQAFGNLWHLHSCCSIANETVQAQPIADVMLTPDRHTSMQCGLAIRE